MHRRVEFFSSELPRLTGRLRALAQRARQANLRANLASERVRTILDEQQKHRLLVWTAAKDSKSNDDRSS